MKHSDCFKPFTKVTSPLGSRVAIRWGSSPAARTTQKRPLDVRGPRKRVHLDSKGLSSFKIVIASLGHGFIFCLRRAFMFPRKTPPVRILQFTSMSCPFQTLQYRPPSAPARKLRIRPLHSTAPGQDHCRNWHLRRDGENGSGAARCVRFPYAGNCLEISSTLRQQRMSWRRGGKTIIQLEKNHFG